MFEINVETGLILNRNGKNDVILTVFENVKI